MIYRLSTFLLLGALLAACSPTPESSTSATTESTTAPLPATASEPGLPAPTVAQPDQIEYTTEANPEVIDDHKLAKPQQQISEANEVKEPATKPQGNGIVQPKKKPMKAAEGGPTEAETSSSDNSTPAPASAPEESNAEGAVSMDAPTPKWETMKANAPDHGVFDALLKQYVNSRGDVNYAGLKKEEGKLDAYLGTLANATPARDWSRNEALAYWINAYNAYTLKLLLKNYPVKSITDLHGGKPWDVKWIELGGKTYSLNNIEHDIIRPRYKEPRIHFAVNCAAASCPPLPNKAFTPSNLNSLLESRTRSFIRNDNYNTITDGKVAVSKIFEWYGEDFGDLREYLNKYAETTIPAGTDITFRDYDWALNKQ